MRHRRRRVAWEITDKGWLVAGQPIFLRICWIVPDEDPTTPYTLTDDAIHDLGLVMGEFYVRLEATDATHEALNRLTREVAFGSPSVAAASSAWSKPKVLRVIDAFINEGLLIAGPTNSVGQRSVRLGFAPIE